MSTKLIGVKEFRQNIAAYHKKAVKNGWTYLVLKRNEAIFEVKPIIKKEAALKKLAAEIAEARASAKSGKLYSLGEVRKKLGLK